MGDGDGQSGWKETATKWGTAQKKGRAHRALLDAFHPIKTTKIDVVDAVARLWLLPCLAHLQAASRGKAAKSEIGREECE